MALLAREAEDSLGEDVALDLVAAAVDRVAAREQEQLLLQRQWVLGAGIGGFGVADLAVGAEEVDDQLAEIAVPRAPEELGDAGFRPGHSLGGHRPLGVP